MVTRRMHLYRGYRTPRHFALAVGVAALFSAATARAGAPPDLLDDNRGDAALAVTFTGLFDIAYAATGLPGDPRILATIPADVPARVIGNPSIHNLYWDDDWNGNNPGAATRQQIDAFTGQLVASRYFDQAAEYGVGGASFSGSHESSLACIPPRAGQKAEFVGILEWVSCEISFDPFSIAIGLPGLLPAITGVPKADDNSLYVAYLPLETNIREGGCGTFDAYHFFGVVPDVDILPVLFIPIPTSRTFPFAVVATRCLDTPSLDNISAAATHEIIEAATDPSVGLGWINDSVVSSGGGTTDLLTALSNAFNNISLDLEVGEAADICEETANPILGPPAFQHPTPPLKIPASDPALGQDHIMVAPYWSNELGLCGPFQPPHAVCKDIVLDADAACHGGPIAAADVDGGSSDVQGPVTLSIDDPGPFPLHSTTVTLTVTNTFGLTAQCQARVTVDDVTPPALEVPPAVSSNLCEAAGSIDVGQATATDNCASVVPTGLVVTKNGSPLDPPLPIVGGQVNLPIGTYTVQWTASDGVNATVATQAVVVGSTIQASHGFLVDDRARVATSSGGDGAVLNSGTGATTLGNDTRSGDIVSVGPVSVGHRAVVDGSVVSASTLGVETDATVQGTETAFGSVVLPALPALPPFPAPGASITVNPSNPPSATNLSPGSYGAVLVNSGGTLNLGDGDYFMRSMTVNAAATVHVTGGTRVFVRDAMGFQSPFRSAGGTVQPTFLGFAGTNLSLQAPFDGTLVAPDAFVSFGTGSGTSFVGSFYASTIEVTNGSTLICTGE